MHDKCLFCLKDAIEKALGMVAAAARRVMHEEK